MRRAPNMVRHVCGSDGGAADTTRIKQVSK